MRILMHMAERYGPVIPVNLANQRVVLLSEPEHFKHVLVTKADDYIKYFDGLKPIFGKSMITNDGALWQKIRMPQQPAFHPDMFAEYIPYFLAAIRTKMDIWAELAKSGETIEMVEQTWTLAADMICKALFDRDMPFNPHFVFKCVKTYTDVMNHKSIRLKRQAGEEFEMTEEDAAKAMEMWASVPPAVFGADPREERERTLLKMIEAAVADPNVPEFDQQQAVDELKQYLWAGTETTALTLAWALYRASRHPESGRAHPQGRRAGLRRPRADRRRLLGARLHPRRDPGDDAALSADLGPHPRRHRGRRDRRQGDPPRRPRRAVRLRRAPQSALLGRAGGVPPRALHGRRRQEAVKPYTYLPFGGGKRSCIGGAMSQVENTLALSMLLRRFRPEYVGNDPAGINAHRDADPQGRPHVQDPRAELGARLGACASAHACGAGRSGFCTR